ncbi:hypothetical protein ASF22_11270 [Methylobacterium sp. Leaf87]|nr:hypothetical protein ASF22_11270 [Methylobacterium sp. Leaf87]
MDEVGGALISIALVLTSVFVPTMFIVGISGEFFRQFAVVISVATLISAFNSLSLSPALAGLLLKPHHPHTGGKATVFARLLRPGIDGFNRFFDALSRGYARLIRGVIRLRIGMQVVYAGLVAAAAWVFVVVPRGFVPAADQGFVITLVQLPVGSSLERTDAVTREVGSRVRAIPGVEYAHMFPGRSVVTGTQSSSAGVVFVQFEAFEKRTGPAKSAASIRAEVNRRVADITGAQITVVAPPTIRGIGASGGFSLRVQDLNNNGPVALARATDDLLAALKADPRILLAFTPFSTNAPQFFVDVDRTKAEMLNMPVQNVHSTLEAYLGSAYVNDFNLSGRTYQVIAQAEGLGRLDVEQIGRLKARSDTGAMVPLDSVASFSTQSAPDRVPRYNLFLTAEIIGSAVPAVSSDAALTLVDEIAARTLPEGFAIEWTELSYQQRLAGDGIVTFLLSVVFVYLVLASQYESWTLPFAVVLIVPMCLLSAISGVLWMGQDNNILTQNILTQVVLVVLVGLAAKNAILIVEFARDLENQGRSIVDAVVEAGRLRLRPILMTSLAFILGVVPLMIAKGAGAELRHAIGTTVFFGMVCVTVFGLIFTPIFYVCLRDLAKSKLTARIFGP